MLSALAKESLVDAAAIQAEKIILDERTQQLSNETDVTDASGSVVAIPPLLTIDLEQLEKYQPSLSHLYYFLAAPTLCYQVWSSILSALFTLY